MVRRFLVIFLVLVATSLWTNCKKSSDLPVIPVKPETEKAENKLPSGEFDPVATFIDDFSSLNKNIWDYRTDQSGGWACRAANVSIEKDNDQSYLALNFNKDLQGVFVGAGVKSKEKLGYGYFSAKVKLYKATGGLHQSWWMIGPTLEIDGMEVDSDSTIYRGQRLTGNYHRISPNKKAGVFPFTYEPKKKVDLSQWFVISWERTATDIHWYITTDLDEQNSAPILIKSYKLTDSDVFAAQHILLSAKPHDPYAYLNGYGSVKGVQDPIPNARMLIDWVKFYPRKPDGNINLISNNSFEYDNAKILENTQNMYIPAEWVVDSNNKNAKNCYVEKDGAYQGEAKLVHSGASNYVTNTSQSVNRIPNSKYILKLWTRSSGGQNKAVIRVRGFDNTGSVREVIIPKGNSWTQIIIDNINVENNNAVIEMISDAHGGEWVHADNFTFNKSSH